MRYYIIAGEASGDLHGSNLMRQLKVKDPAAEFRVWGGDLMKASGGELVKHYHELAFMGFKEVLLNIKTILANIKFCKSDIESYKPDVVILIDYPGFNMRIGAHARSLGLKVFYYISPQVWAWKKSRVKKIKQFVDRMFVILPFEKKFYADLDYEVDYVGHPLLDAIDEKEGAKTEEIVTELDADGKGIVAVLPGSRKQEVSKMLDTMLGIRNHFPDYTFVIACAPSIEKEFYEQYRADGVKLVFNKTYDLLKVSRAALVTSGTATLETAIFGVPEVVCYSAGNLSYQIAKKLINVAYISLVNLIMEKEVVKELIQDEFNHDTLKQELDRLLNDDDYVGKMKENYKALVQKLGNSGASERTAELMVKYLNES